MNKKTITEIVVQELPVDHPDKSISIDKLYLKYWYTGRNSDVLRLTQYGYEAFKDAGIQKYSYAFNIESLMTKLNKSKGYQVTMQVGKILKCPWYISKKDQKTLVLDIFDSKIAMMINLYGSVEDYFKSKL